MRFHVTFRTFEHITGQEEIEEHRRFIREKLEQFRDSGKLMHGAVFVDDRAAYCVFDVNSEAELFELMTPAQDSMEIETHPIVPFEKMEDFFQQEMSAMEA